MKLKWPIHAWIRGPRIPDRHAPALSIAAALTMAGPFGAWNISAGENRASLLQYEAPKQLDAKIFLKNSSQNPYLFTFHREVTRVENSLNVLRQYADPQGKTVAREKVIYHGDELASYELDEVQTGATGRAEFRSDPGEPSKRRIWFSYREAGPGSHVKTNDEPLQPNTLVNDTVGPFLAAHRDALLRSEGVKCRYVVIPRTETVGFSFKKESETTLRGHAVLIIKMEPTSFVISALVDPLYFKMEKDPPYRVFEYEGRTTPKLKSGNKWKDLDAVTVFDWKE